MELLAALGWILAAAAAWAWWTAEKRARALEALSDQALQRAEKAELAARAALEERDASVSRVRAQAQDEARFAQAPLVNELIPVMDDFDRALQHGEEHPLVAGVRLIRQRLLQAMTRNGVRVQDPLGERFDPSWHEAIDTRADPQAQEYTVVERWGLAFWMHERLLRPAPVVVGSAPPSPQPEQAAPAGQDRGDEDPPQDPGPPAQGEAGPEPASEG